MKNPKLREDHGSRSKVFNITRKKEKMNSKFLFDDEISPSLKKSAKHYYTKKNRRFADEIELDEY
jgi:hypothetical protein